MNTTYSGELSLITTLSLIKLVFAIGVVPFLLVEEPALYIFGRSFASEQSNGLVACAADPQTVQRANVGEMRAGECSVGQGKVSGIRILWNRIDRIEQNMICPQCHINHHTVKDYSRVVQTHSPKEVPTSHHHPQQS